MATQPAYSLKSYFGGTNTDSYKKYKEGQKEGKWGDFTGYISGGGNNQYTSFGDFFNKQGKALTDYRTQLMTDLGITPLRESLAGTVGNINDVQGRLEALPADVAQETRGFDVNASQRRAIEAKKTVPLSNQMSQLGRTANTLQATLGQKETEMTDQLKIKSDLQARESTGYFMQAQTALDQLMYKLQRADQMDDREWQQAADLAKLERQYKYELGRIGAQANADIKVNAANPTNTYAGLPLLFGQNGGTNGGTTPQQQQNPATSTFEQNKGLMDNIWDTINQGAGDLKNWFSNLA